MMDDNHNKHHIQWFLYFVFVSVTIRISNALVPFFACDRNYFKLYSSTDMEPSKNTNHDNINNSNNNNNNMIGYTTLPQYLKQKKVNSELYRIICAAAHACIDISQKLQYFPIQNSNTQYDRKVNVQGEVQKEMDVIANEIFIEKVKDAVVVLASEEEEDVIEGYFWDHFYSKSNKQNNEDDILGYEIAFDPLDGSSNLDVNVPTGTIFGIAPHIVNKSFSSSGRCLVAAGYCVYSSSIEFVISLGQSGCDGCASFTLNQYQLHELCRKNIEDVVTTIPECFILSRPNMRCPTSGPYYSLNDGREPDWPQGLKRWVQDAKRGLTPSKTIFSSRYICSLCADVHRTLIKGGWAGNPRPHLRLLYEASPLAHVVEACGGKGSDGIQNLLDLVPNGLHDRTSVFIGSMDDIIELESYGDIQQGAKKYET